MHTRLGYQLFAESEFDEAMAHFGMCSDASPVVLLHLFPSLAPPHLIQALEGTISGGIITPWPPVCSMPVRHHTCIRCHTA